MKRWFFEFIALATVLNACSAIGPEGENRGGTLLLDCGRPRCKSASMDEESVWDVNVWVYSPDGKGEYHAYLPFREARTGSFELELSLLLDRNYEFFALANAGFDIGFPSRDDVYGYRLHLSHPDGDSKGMPMSAHAFASTDYGKPVTLSLERMMSKINVSVDKSGLRKDVRFNVMGVRIGNCPTSASAFVPSAVRTEEDCFAAGYFAEGSGKMQLYMLENIAGDEGTASYIEMEIDYESDLYLSSGKGLVYRFKLCEQDGFAVRRNCCYNITVVPGEDGLLSEDSWKVDRNGLLERDREPYLLIDPPGTVVDGRFYEHYYEMSRGESRHFKLVRYPGNMTVRLREDLVDLERKEGRAIYTMDEDMNGFTVTALERVCLSSMEIEGTSPLNDFEMISISVK